MRAQPMVGNLAWAPLPAFEEVEALDRFNGVPTLGIIGAPGDRVLFWRALGYVPPPHELSLWIYVPISPYDEERLGCAEPAELLDGLIFRSENERQVMVGLAQGYRLQFGFEWTLPAKSNSDEVIRRLLISMRELLADTSRESHSPERKRAARKASKALRDLVPC
jgi:hypothetical protein